MLHKFIPYLCN